MSEPTYTINEETGIVTIDTGYDEVLRIQRVGETVYLDMFTDGLPAEDDNPTWSINFPLPVLMRALREV